MQRTATGTTGLVLYLVLVLISTFMAAVTGTVAAYGDWIGLPFAVLFAAFAIVIGWFGRYLAVDPLTEWCTGLVHRVKQDWPYYAAKLVMCGAILVALYYVAAFFIWAFTETPAERAQREASERYRADMVVYRQYVDACAKKNGAKHFGPMIGFEPIDGGCGLGSRNNGVACTWNNQFQQDLKKLWDDARARGACIVYKDATVIYSGSTRINPGIAAYGDDGHDTPIYLGLRGKK